MAQSQHFSPDDFTPTKFSTAEQKAAFANQLLAFIAAGFPEKKFTNAAVKSTITWPVDETYVKVGGHWKYLFRAVDKHGRLIDFMLMDRRNTRVSSETRVGAQLSLAQGRGSFLVAST